jgi:hypothetical protein
VTRALYRSIVWLHPPQFRRQFGEEMLWVYDQAAPVQGPFGLLADGLVSFARQWLVRHGGWKVLVALAGALLEVLLVLQLTPPARQSAPQAWTFDTRDFDFSRLLAFVFGLLALSAMALAAAARPRRIRARRRR